MDKKTYCAKTSNGYILVGGATLEYLEVKFELSLNDLLEAERLDRGEKLSRKIRIRTESEIYKNLYSSSRNGRYLITIEREH